MQKNIIMPVLFLTLLLIQCKTARVSKNNIIPFKDIEFKLIMSKSDDSVFIFNNLYNFNVKFHNKKFRGFDGSFKINQIIPDTNLSKYNFNNYQGFYNSKSKDSISLHWFSNISWNMDFSSKIGQILGNAFRFEGKYEYSQNRVYFYREASNKKDTIIILEKAQ